ncbi:ABC transporter permease [Henriciella aquimarina]|uniref:ABC transporter permease n=1 Tax=Henriciella aquimarina TaxID=545261 RepID=UPI000A045094|nr:ABC transporter permease [Henriciella aquimarina]
MRLRNILHLGIKELRSLLLDPFLAGFIVFAFTFSIWTAATAMPDTVQNAVLAVVDEDQSPLSQRLSLLFQEPYFAPPIEISRTEMDPGLDAGDYTFALYIPSEFQSDLLAGRRPTIQLAVDATRMSQAFEGSGYIQSIISAEVSNYLGRGHEADALPVDLVIRSKFNQALDGGWFGAIVEIINNVTMIAVILTGAALIREREHGTVEHLLVMPVTSLEIMLSKVWSMGLVVLAASLFSLWVVVQMLLQVPIHGSTLLFALGAALHLFSVTSMAIFMATVARTMPQFGLLMILVIMPLDMLSGGMTPRENMPEFVQTIMLAAPTTHFVSLSQGVLFRGAGLEIVWPQLLALTVIGSVFFVIAHSRFKKTLGSMA